MISTSGQSTAPNAVCNAHADEYGLWGLSPHSGVLHLAISRLSGVVNLKVAYTINQDIGRAWTDRLAVLVQLTKSLKDASVW